MAGTRHISVSLSRKEILWGWIYLAAELLVLPTVLIYISGRLFPGVTGAEVNFLYYLLNFIAVILIFGGYLKRNLNIAGSNLLRTLLCVLLGLAGYWASNLIMAEFNSVVMPDFVNVNDMTISAISKDGYFLMALGTVLLVPTAEECMFRGLLFRGFYGKSRWAAYTISAICFSLIHIGGYLGSYDPALLAMCFIQYLPAGLILAWCYEKSNTIVTPILIHTLINAIGIYSMR